MPTSTGLTRGTGQGLVAASEAVHSIHASGSLLVMDFYAMAVLDGHGFQVRAGTITTPLVGGAPNADTVAEFCCDCVAGTTIIPLDQQIGVRLGTGTLHEYASKSVATVSSAGTAFVPLPLLSNGTATSTAAVTTARVAAHGVTVTAELATTTLRHWEYANPVVAGAGNDPGLASMIWQPLRPPILRGPRCFYTQIAATGTGPSYYAHLDYLEFSNTALGLAV